MSISTRHRLAAAVTVVAAAGTVSLAATPAFAAAAPASEHCSSWKTVASTKYALRVCGDLKTTKSTHHVLESLYIRNSGHQNVALDGDYGVSWGQAGTGVGFVGEKVRPGKTKVITKTFDAGTGPYKIVATLNVGKASKTVQQTFKK